MDWIMSGGGPMICLERALEDLWGGVDQLTLDHPTAQSDYDRACQTRAYLNLVPLKQQVAIAVGVGPMDTSIWHSPSGRLFIVQVFCAEPEISETDKLAKLDESIFDNPHHLSEWQAFSSSLVLFDAAIPGNEREKESLFFCIYPGRYRIQTQQFDPDAEVSFLLHRFDPID